MARSSKKTNERSEGSSRQLYRDLIDHPSVLPYLEKLIAEREKGVEWEGRFYLSHEYGLQYKPDDWGFGFHNGGAPAKPWLRYHVQDGEIYCNLTCVTWCLTDVLEGEGGFGCLPGSHKAHFPAPEEIRELKLTPDTVHQPVVNAGDAIIFSEALIHGPLPYSGESDRLALFYKYTPGHVPLMVERPSALLDQVTERQRQILTVPHI
jgi:hypothetical protein